MLLIISPSKTQKIDGACPEQYTLPVFLSEIKTLVKHLKSLDREGLAGLMDLSEKLADTTWRRFQDFSPSFNSKNGRPAIQAFQGDVYTGIRAREFTSADLRFAQKHLRIISGLYGLLRPLDLVQPYRLEMKTKLKISSAEDLYGFWGSRITDCLSRDMEASGGTHLVNLASKEYFKAIKPSLPRRQVLDISFKVKNKGQYKVIAIHAKRTRGLMVNFVIRNRLVDIDDLKKFNEEGYLYNDDLSSELQWVFCRD